MNEIRTLGAWGASLGRALIPLALALHLSVAHASQGDEFRNRGVIGKWQLVSILDYAAIGSLDERGARRLLGQVLFVEEGKVRLNNEVCPASEFWSHYVEPELDVREKAHTSASLLRLPNPVEVVELSCAFVYIRTPDRMVVLWDGVFFETVRLKR